MASFNETIGALISAEMKAAIRVDDRDRVAGVIEVLAAQLGKTIAIAGQGEAQTISVLCTGAENHMTETAAEFARVVTAMTGARR